MLRVLDLFSGIGGFSLGLERAGMETVAFCEMDKFCQKVLKKHWPNVQIFDDVRLLDGKQFRGSIDVVGGGISLPAILRCRKTKRQRRSKAPLARNAQNYY